MRLARSIRQEKDDEFRESHNRFDRDPRYGLGIPSEEVRERHYREWCWVLRQDPEDVGSMIAYEDNYNPHYDEDY